MPVPYPTLEIPRVLTSTGAVDTITELYAWATFSNDGLANAIITWAPGSVLVLLAGKSITLPCNGSVYGTTTIDTTSGTTVRVVYTV